MVGHACWLWHCSCQSQALESPESSHLSLLAFSRIPCGCHPRIHTHASTHPPNLPLQGELVDEMHRTGVVESTKFTEQGTEVRGRVPAPLAMRLHPLRLEAAAAALAGGQREP